MARTFDLDNMIKIKFDSINVNYIEFEKWMKANMPGRYFVGFSEIFFDKESDAIIFKLRWC